MGANLPGVSGGQEVAELWAETCMIGYFLGYCLILNTRNQRLLELLNHFQNGESCCYLQNWLTSL
jgi:hypothetical protein